MLIQVLFYSPIRGIEGNNKNKGRLWSYADTE